MNLLFLHSLFPLPFTPALFRKQKELLKALETPEEKRARRLAKKEAKLRKEREKMGWDQEYMVWYGWGGTRSTHSMGLRWNQKYMGDLKHTPEIRTPLY